MSAASTPGSLRRPNSLGTSLAIALDGLASAPPALALAPLLIAAGAAVLAWDFAVLPPDPVNHALYWLGLAMGFAGVAALGLAGRPSWARQAVALGLLGALTWLPYLLRSPDRLVFVDELYHRDVLQRILDTGHATGLAVTLYPIPGAFPGLEAATVALLGATGLSMDAGIRVLTLVLHVTIPALAWLVGRGLGLGGRIAFLAALVYAANTGFGFFHAVYSYESLGIVLVLATWALVALAIRPVPSGAGAAAGSLARAAARRRRTLLLVAIAPVAAVAVTHHISAYLLGASLVVAGLALRWRHHPGWKGVLSLGGLGLALALAWSLANASRLAPYLLGTLGVRLAALAGTLSGLGAPPRALFATPDQPALERMLAFSYPILVLLLAVGGALAVRRVRPRSPLWPALVLLGPIAWIATTPAVITRSGELAYRAWPFVFVALAPVAALALAWLVRVADRHRLPGLAIAVVLVGALTFGARSVGEHQAGRFPAADPPTAAGGAADTADVVDAARWLLATAGPGHLVASDVGTSVEFGTTGGQRILGWQAWYPFLVRDPNRAAGFLRATGTEYLVLDTRITRKPSRYGAYFGQPPVPASLDPGEPVPASVVAALDRVPGMDRVYQGTNLVIYHFTSLAGATR